MLLGKSTLYHVEGKNRKQLNFAREETFSRDNFTCKFCGLYSKKKLEVYEDENNPNNLITACPFCFAALCGGLREDEDVGTIIYAPEFTQSEINWTTHVIIAAMGIGGGLSVLASELMGQLEDRKDATNEIWGDGLSSPRVMVSVFSKLPQKHYEAREQLFPGLRFLPDPAKFEAEIAYWKENLYSEMGKDMFNNVFDKWSNQV